MFFSSANTSKKKLLLKLALHLDLTVQVVLRHQWDQQGLRER